MTVKTQALYKSDSIWCERDNISFKQIQKKCKRTSVWMQNASTWQLRDVLHLIVYFLFITESNIVLSKLSTGQVKNKYHIEIILEEF